MTLLKTSSLLNSYLYSKHLGKVKPTKHGTLKFKGKLKKQGPYYGKIVFTQPADITTGIDILISEDSLIEGCSSELIIGLTRDYDKEIVVLPSSNDLVGKEYLSCGVKINEEFHGDGMDYTLYHYGNGHSAKDRQETKTFRTNVNSDEHKLGVKFVGKGVLAFFVDRKEGTKIKILPLIDETKYYYFISFYLKYDFEMEISTFEIGNQFQKCF